MAQTGFTPIKLYASTTASAVPTSGNLDNTNGAELAINTADGKLFYKDSSGVVQTIASKAGNVNVASFSGGTTGLTPNTATTGAVTLAGTLAVANGGTGLTAPGASGNVLTSNGTAFVSSPVPAGGLTYLYRTTNYTALDKQGVLADTSAGAFTVTLPATPTTGVQVVIADAGAAFGTNNLTVARNGSTIGGLAEDLVINITGVSVQCVFDGTTWEVYAQVGGNGGNAVTLTGVQTLTNKTISGASNTLTNIPLTTAVTGTLPVANGGTGATSLTANNVILGNGTSAVQVVAPGTSGNVLTSNGTTFVSQAPAAGGSLILLATVTPTAAANVNFLNTFTSAYDDYLIVVDGALSSAGGSPVLNMQVAQSGAAVTSSIYYSGSAVSTSITATTTSATVTGVVDYQSGAVGGNTRIYVNNVNTATGSIKTIDSYCITQSNSLGTYQFNRFVAAMDTSALSGFRLFWSNGGNFQAVGKIRVYGIKNT